MPAMRTTLVLTALSSLVLSGCTQGSAPEPVATPSDITRPSGAPTSSAPTSSAAPSSGSTTSAAGLARCTDHDVRVGAGEVQASASTRTLTLELTNVSNERCTVTGFGGLALLDASGAQLPTSFQRGDEQPRRIELAPQSSTTRTISWQVVPAQGTDPDRDCITGDALLVTPPDEQPGNLIVHKTITACEGGTITGTPWARKAR